MCYSLYCFHVDTVPIPKEMEKNSFGKKSMSRIGLSPNGIAYYLLCAWWRVFRIKRTIVISMRCSIILKCFAHQYDQDRQRVVYVTEAVTDCIVEYEQMNSLTVSSFSSVGVISLKVLRKWLLSLLNALNYLHNEAPLSPLIHGHLQWM